MADATFDERFTGEQAPTDTMPSVEMFGTPEAMAAAVPHTIGALSGYNLLQYIGTQTKAAMEGKLTPEQEADLGATGAMLTIGSGAKFAVPKEMFPHLQAFHDEVIAPAAERSATRLTIPLDERNIAAEPKIAPAAPEEPVVATPHPIVSELQEARNLGITGPERLPHPEDTPAQAAQRAIPANRYSDPNDKITMTPGGEPIDAYQQRFAEWVSKIKEPGDIDNIIARTAEEQGYFPQAREGEIPAAHIEELAKASGFDSTKFDPELLRTKFNSDDEIRAVEHVLLQTRDDYRSAIEAMKTDPNEANLDAAIAARGRHEKALEYVAAFRSDWGKAGLAQQEFLSREKMREQYAERTRNGIDPEPNDLIAATEEFSRRPSKVGLQGLIEAAQKAVDAAKPKIGHNVEPPPPPPEGVADLTKAAEDALKRLSSGDRRTALERLVAGADRAVGPRKAQAQRAVVDQLPPELQSLIDKAERVTKRFVGIDREKAELNAVGEATQGLPKEGFSYVLGKAMEMANRKGVFSFDTLFWLRNNWLLSGPVTHTFYFAVNTGSVMAEHVLIPGLAAAIDKVRGGKNNFFGEPFAGAWGIVNTVPGALKAAMEAARTGMRVPLESELRLAERGEESPQSRGAKIPYLAYSSPDWGALKSAADWLGVPMAARTAAELTAGGAFGRFANLQHTFFKVLGEGANAHREAYAATAKEGLNPLKDAEFADRYRYHLENPTDDVLRNNVNAGFRGTFMEKLGEKTTRLASALKNTPLRWEFPFLHVPLNIARRGVSWSPLAYFGPEMRATLNGANGPRAQATALAAVVGGTAAIAYITNLATQGKVTGDYPADAKEQARWKALNIQPNSFKVGDEWLSYNRFGPARYPFAYGALLGDIINHYDLGKSTDEEMAKAVGQAIVGTVKATSNEVGMLALHNTFEAMNGERGMARFGADTVRSFLPYNVGAAQIAAYNDPYMRSIKGFKDSLKYGIPGLRQTLPPKRDALFGEPLPNPAYQSFIRSTPATPDPIKAELDRIGYHPGPPRSELSVNKSKVQLTPEQYDKYEATAGQAVRRWLGYRMRLPDWQMLSPEIQKEEAKKYITLGRAEARRAMQVDDLSLVNAARQQRLMQIHGP